MSLPDPPSIRARPALRRALTMLAAVALAAVAWSGSGEEPGPQAGAPPGYILLPDFAGTAERLDPAVVGVTSIERRERGRGGDSGRGRWHRLPPDHPPFELESAGSGFIISPDGYILTNRHVIENGRTVRVELTDGSEHEARVIGSDEEVDIALLKLDLEGELPSIPLGDSDRVRVGEWVMAIGNPLLYDHTVTVGVISGVGRELGASNLVTFLQTDAAINLGNSGGPLLNLKGEAIGINTAVSSEGQNIGFAVPVNLVKAVLPQLMAKGRVDRGYLGIRVGPVDESLAARLELPAPSGVHVMSVDPGLPADRAGLRQDDVIVSVDGTPVADAQELVRSIGSHEPGSSVELELYRKGTLQTLAATLTRRPTPEERAELDAERDEERPADSLLSSLGLSVADLTPAQVTQHGLPAGTPGLVITRVEPDGPAARADLRQGDVLLRLDRDELSSLAELQRRLEAKPAGSDVLFYVSRAGRLFFVTLTTRRSD